MATKKDACPFKNTEALAAIADNAISTLEENIEGALNSILTSGINEDTKKQVTQLDDLYLEAITAIQNATIRLTICPFCELNSTCHPES